MSTRTQIYLTDEQRSRIDAEAEAEGITMAEVVRRALTAYLDTSVPDPTTALTSTFGRAPDASTPSRDEWDRG